MPSLEKLIYSNNLIHWIVDYHASYKGVVCVRNANRQVWRDLSVSNYLVQTTKSRVAYHGRTPTILRDAKGRMFMMIIGLLSVMAVSNFGGGGCPFS